MSNSWRQSLLPATFAGVPFWVESAKVPVGIKGVLHEYPQRDQAYFESLGHQARTHTLTGFVIGPDCFEQRDRLLQALALGAGELLHPWLGRMQVKVGECELSHDRKAGGVASFTLKFHPDAPLKFPTVHANTGQQLEKAADSLLDSAVARYRTVMAQVDKARINLLGLRSRLSGVYNLINQQFKPLLAVVGNLNGLVQSVVTAPFALGGLFSSYFAQLKEGLNGAGAYRGVLASATQQAEGAAQLDSLVPANGKDTSRAAQASADLLQDALLVQAALLIARMPVADAVPVLGVVPTLAQQVVQPVQRHDVPVVDDVLALRDQLEEVIWQASLKADAEHYQALSLLRQQLLAHLNAVAASGVRMLRLTPEQTLPALVLAYRRFADATRAGEIVQRNRILHPGFVPPLPLQVAQE